jgi:regulator of replication initiation timing
MIEGKRGCADTEKQRRDKLVQEDGKSGEAGELARSCAEPAGDCAEPQTDGGAPAVQQLEMELAQAKRRLAMLAQHVEELETEVADLKLENDRLYSDIADILSSSTWRMLAPFRSAVGWLRKNITGRLHAYRQLKKKKMGL